MSEAVQVLVVGAGLAGMSAASALADLGISVRLIEQAPVIGGAVLRQALHGTDHRLHGPHQDYWSRLMIRIQQQRNIKVSCSCQFGGVDSDGRVLLVHSSQGTHEMLQPRALIVAVGATERIRPRPGWNLPGVMTAGSIQVGMKTSLTAPQGRIVLAGTGPLLLAVGAQMTRMGAPPLAIVEAANPLGRWYQALRLPIVYGLEAAGYWLTLKRAKVPIWMQSEVTDIAQQQAGLRVHVNTPKGIRILDVDSLGLHDGILPNDYGLSRSDHLIWRNAGDCHEALGARAAAAHGELVANEIGALLKPGSAAIRPEALKRLERERSAQALLKLVYEHDEKPMLDQLPLHTVICRCENRTLGDLKALGEQPTVREIRLLGRFAMGACQGRFCGHWVQCLTGNEKKLSKSVLTAAHWPSRPLSIQGLVTTADHLESTSPESVK